MQTLAGQITFLVGQDSTNITIQDKLSGQIICEVELTPNQLSSALSRLAHTPCTLKVYDKGFDRIGKRMETDTLEFAIPDGLTRRDADSLARLAVESAPEGWSPDRYFGSQGSVFNKDGKSFARCVIRRWVDGTT